MPITIPTTTAAPPTVAATPTATLTATAARRPLFARTRLVHRERTPLEVLMVKHADGLRRVFLRPHFDKGKAARPPGRPVLHYVDCDDRPGLREMILQVVFRGCECEVPNE